VAKNEQRERAVAGVLLQFPCANSAQISDRTGIPKRAIRKTRAWIEREGIEPAECEQPTAERPTPTEWLDHAERAAQLEQRARVDRRHGIYAAPDTLAVVFAGDLHAGGVWTDHRAVSRLFEIVRQPGWAGVELGDSCQNKYYAGHMEAVLGQGISPKRQKDALFGLFAATHDRWAAKLAGNHERADSHGAGESWTERLHDAGVPIFASPSILTLHVGEQVYRVCLAHKFKGGGLSPVAKAQKLMATLCPTADVSATAHIHRPALQVARHYDSANEAGLGYGGRCTCLVAGTAQRYNDPYGQAFGDGGKLAFPTVVFHADTHHHVAFWSPEEAACYLRGLHHE